MAVLLNLAGKTRVIHLFGYHNTQDTIDITAITSRRARYTKDF
jgi:hypothetical protein